MKRLIKLTMVCMTLVMFVSCERVAPNYAGVLMENYGKQGKEDFKIVSGKVSTWELGTELFQVPLFDQRGEFAEAVTLKAADNTEFKACPTAIKLSRTVPLMLSLTTSILAVEVTLCLRWKITSWNHVYMI